MNGPFTGPLGAAVLTEALKDQAAGIGEAPDANNAGPLLAPYFAEFGQAMGQNWCAMAVGTWIRRAAAALGVARPIEGSMGAKATQAQLVRAGAWQSAAALRARPGQLIPGMVAIWDRSDPARPETSWWGHIGIVREVDASGAFRSVEGNALPHVATIARSLHDVRLLGAGNLDAAAGASSSGGGGLGALAVAGTDQHLAACGREPARQCCAEVAGAADHGDAGKGLAHHVSKPACAGKPGGDSRAAGSPLVTLER